MPPSSTSPEPKAKLPAGEQLDVFDTSKTFEDLGLHEKLLQGIEALGFKHPDRLVGFIYVGTEKMKLPVMEQPVEKGS